MKKLVLVLAFAFVGSSSWADCTSDQSQVISKLKLFDSRVSEQSHATVKTDKNSQAETISLGDILGSTKKACGSSGSASLTVVNPQTNQTFFITFSKKGGSVFATSNGKSAQVSL